MLGIIDWGIGGIGVYKALKASRPDASVIYFSDTGVTPYGKMAPDDLVERLDRVIAFVKSQGVTHLIIGCNAASTAIPRIDPQGLKIEGVIDSAVEATARLKPKRLGLIGGKRTVVSGVYRRAFADRGIEVDQRVAQPLSALIEAGDLSSDTLRNECRRILSPIKNSSHLLLACTHYPAIRDVIREFVLPWTVIIDPAAELVRRTARWQFDAGENDRFFTSGDPTQMKRAARLAFGCKLTNVSGKGLHS